MTTMLWNKGVEEPVVLSVAEALTFHEVTLYCPTILYKQILNKQVK